MKECSCNGFCLAICQCGLLTSLDHWAKKNNNPTQRAEDEEGAGYLWGPWWLVQEHRHTTGWVWSLWRWAQSGLVETKGENSYTLRWWHKWKWCFNFKLTNNSLKGVLALMFSSHCLNQFVYNMCSVCTKTEKTPRFTAWHLLSVFFPFSDLQWCQWWFLKWTC